MKSIKGFWLFLDTAIKDIPWGDVALHGIEAMKALPDASKAWQDNADKIQQLAPFVQKAEPLIKALDIPVTKLVISGLPFISAGINLLKIGIELAKVESTFESSVTIVAQLAYLQSLEIVLVKQDETIKAKLAQLSLKDVVEKQLSKFYRTELTLTEAKTATTQFRESILVEKFGEALTEQLQQVGLDNSQTQRLTDQVIWGSHRYFHLAIVEAGESVEPLAEFYRTGGQQELERYTAIDEYLETQIKPTPLEQVFDESAPRVSFQDIYVQLEVQPLTQEGEVKRGASPICSHEWTKKILEQSANQTRKVMFMEGEAGRGKSVFCRMIADWVYSEFGDAFIPLRIRLRDLRALANNLTETLEDCPDLEQAKFVRGESNWLADKNTRFFLILDGFDEILLEGRTSGGLKEFLQQVTDFQRRSHHQLLVTGRPLALQGIDRLITQNKDLERVRLKPMSDELRELWLIKWQAIFGTNQVNQFRQFLTACPQDITDTLAREPLLLYLLARLNREGHLTQEMFADTQKGFNSETQAKLQIYRESVNWVLKKQRQDENLRLSGLDTLDDLREVLQEAALCVVQSGNETARLEMVKQRFKGSSNPVADLLKQAQETTGQSENKALNNLLTTFYLKPGEKDKRGSVEFAHKSFGEYLFAERLLIAFETWTELDKRKRFRLDERSLNEQIYDVFGHGGLTQEIVAYVMVLLEEGNIDRLQLFTRLSHFYDRWCQNEFLDALPHENIPQKKMIQLLDQDITTGLKQVDVFTGLNAMIFLFRLHASTQPKDYPYLGDDTSQHEIYFYPCGKPEPEGLQADRLLKIIRYADSLVPGIFNETVGPYLSSANLSSANLSFADLSSANLSFADLSFADLTNTDLLSANLNGADLRNANLNNADLRSADLNSANLNGADLRDANLNSANLSSANLSFADLSFANLSFANLSFADLSSSNLSRALVSDLTQIDYEWLSGSNDEYLIVLRTHQNFNIRIFDSDINSNDLSQLQTALDEFTKISGYEEVTVTREELGSFFKDIRYKIARLFYDDVQREAIETGQELYRTGKANILTRLEWKGVESSKQLAEATAALLENVDKFDNVVLQAGKIIVVKITDENGKSTLCSRTVSSEIKFLLERTPQLIDNPQALYDLLTKNPEQLQPSIENRTTLPAPSEPLK
ncbi:pentapeptide repeat-containing protein [Acaryochloris marina]|uniref:Uncharacterized protein n=1 Tax=Acaryochloris marina (strain MBIC 11017) TaxID=329726 RepID=A8ZQZ6_ACAM1|nr:pentapeptide repeat-containing protein [Acaryochloris marina]ABW33432.1 conserved hypothetical protein [Acaryochloris marina MBIC11017]